jgi:protoporphyrinogen oxidase
MEKNMIEIDYMILGAGPTGLGAAYRLNELGENNILVIDKNDKPGGLSRSFVDENGFIWDIGGHVQFSHYDYFDKAMHAAIPANEWNMIDREAWVWLYDRFVPYPFQNNIRILPKEALKDCLEGLINIEKKEVKNFEDWIHTSFGKGIANHFLLPYNYKVWAFAPKGLNYSWVGERVAKVDLMKILTNILDQRDEKSWGPNNKFAFPKNGGTGRIWENISEIIGLNRIKLNEEILEINYIDKIVRTNKSTYRYKSILSTLPLNSLGKLIYPINNDLEKFTKNLKYSSSHIVGIGLKGDIPDSLKTKSWMYFPESNCPFYRTTVFSNYSKNNVPGAEYWSLMTETSESTDKPVDEEKIVNDTIEGLLNTRLILDKNQVVSKWYFKANLGYPTPYLNRDDDLKSIFDELKKMNIDSRGRFGAWKYEVSNQDHSFMQGVEWVNKVKFEIPETTLFFPNTANSNWGRND